MKVVLDTNVILDVWLAREPFWPDSARLLGLVETGAIAGIICPATVTTLHYLAGKVLGEQRARKLVGNLLAISEVGNLDAAVFQDALSSGIRDFEDAVIEAVAVAAGADHIATRNLKDFRNSRVPACGPAELLPRGA